MTAIVSEVGGYVTLFYALLLAILSPEVFRFHQRQSVRLVDEAASTSRDFSDQTLELIKERVSVEGLFTLHDEANIIKKSLEFENEEIRRQLAFNK